MQANHYSLFTRWSLILICFFSTPCFALPFTITPNEPLPTTVPTRGSTRAVYAISNNTQVQRNNNIVKYLPLNVTVDDSAGCGSTFSLAAEGQSGDSCLLNLIISGPVDAADPNPHNHMFICFPGGMTCAGPAYANSLNVTQTSSPITYLRSVQCNSSGTHCVTVGASARLSDTSADRTALSYISNDSGSSWALSSPLTLPINGFRGGLLSVTCANNQCATVGAYIDLNETEFPLSYTSNDGGAHWSLSTTLPPPQGTEDFLTGVSCNSTGLLCAAVGYYEGGPYNSTPLGYSSSDGGVTWSLSTFTSLADIQLHATSCTNTFCVAVGVKADAPTIPFVYRSTDNGATWQLPTTPPPLQGSNNSDLQSVSCHGTNCLTVGKHEFNRFPVTYISTNSGDTWTISASLPSSSVPLNDFYNVSCDATNTHCVLSAVYFDINTLRTAPVTYISNDGGNNWSAPNYFAIQDIFSFFSTVYCDNSGSKCVLVDTAFNDLFNPVTYTVNYAYTSQDGGVTWSSPTIIVAGHTLKACGVLNKESLGVYSKSLEQLINKSRLHLQHK